MDSRFATFNFCIRLYPFSYNFFIIVLTRQIILKLFMNKKKLVKCEWCAWWTQIKIYKTIFGLIEVSYKSVLKLPFLFWWDSCLGFTFTENWLILTLSLLSGLYDSSSIYFEEWVAKKIMTVVPLCWFDGKDGERKKKIEKKEERAISRILLQLLCTYQHISLIPNAQSSFWHPMRQRISENGERNLISS